MMEWWTAESADRFRAYYMTMRVAYEMTALEAFTVAKRAFREYPEFFRDPAGTLRRALRSGAQS